MKQLATVVLLIGLTISFSIIADPKETVQGQPTDNFPAFQDIEVTPVTDEELREVWEKMRQELNENGPSPQFVTTPQLRKSH